MLDQLAPAIRRAAREVVAAGNYLLEADDLFQEGMLSAWLSLQQGHGNYPAGQLRVHAIQRARWAMLDYARACANRHMIDPISLGAARPERGADFDAVLADVPGPHEVVEARLCAHRLRAAIVRLPRRLRQVIGLLHADKPSTDLGPELGMSSDLFRYHHKEAIRRLRLDLGVTI